MSKTGCIYCLKDPRDGSVRYVGQTIKRLPQRLSEHVCRPAGKRMRAWIVELDALGLRPSIEALEIVPSADLNARERFWLKEMFLRGERPHQYADADTLTEMHRRGMF